MLIKLWIRRKLKQIKMKELWVKKTIYRRYLIEDSDIEEVENILKNEPKKSCDLIEDIYDKNPHVEYDDESIYIETDYCIQDEDKYITVLKPTYFSKDGTVKESEKIYNDNGDVIKYKALKHDVLC